MERNLVIIVVLIFIVILIFAILHYGFRIIVRSTGIGTSPEKDSSKLQLRYEKKIDTTKEYKMMIEKSKDDYKAFMEKAKSQ